MARRLSIDGIRRAAAAIPPVFRHTPQFVPEGLAARLGLPVLCKVETLNPIGSFKGRGTSWLLATLGERPGRLVTASAGNFGQGLAYAARAKRIPVTVFAATSANPRKVDRMRALGADVRLTGRDLDEAKAAARIWAADHDARFVEDGREVALAEGAGTIADELHAAGEPFDAIVVPVGNGALIAGIATALDALRPEVEVVGVCAAGAPAMAESWAAGRAIAGARADTIADGIAVREPIPEAVTDMLGVVDRMIVVDDAAIRMAMTLLEEEAALIVEPAGAAGLAGILAEEARWRGGRVATVVCGCHR